MKKLLLFIALCSTVTAAQALPAQRVTSDAAPSLVRTTPFLDMTPGQFRTLPGTLSGSMSSSMAAFAPARADKEETGPYPAKVTKLTATPGEHYGQVVLNWTAVTTDEDGKPMSGITYTICRAVLNSSGQQEFVPIVEGLTTLTYTRDEVAADAEQQFEMYGVFAVKDDLVGVGAISGMVPVGKPYDIPYKQSFLFDTPMGMEVLQGDGTWGAANDSQFPSQDSDGGCIVFYSYDIGDSARIFTGRINIPADSAYPTVTYYYYGLVAGDNNRLQVAVNDGSGFIPCGADIVPSQDGARIGGWNRVAVDLSAYKGKCVQLALQVITVNAGNEVFDNMTVAEAPNHDLQIELDMAATAAVGTMVPMSMDVTNFGINDASDYTIDIFVNKVLVHTLNGAPLERGESRSYKYNYVIGPDADETLDVYAVVNYAPDTETGNNTSNHVTVTVDRPIFPAVEKINGYVKDGKVTLEWEAPAFEGARNQIIEDFEAYDSFATMTQGNKGDWVFLDRDGGGQGGFQTHEIPNVPIGQPGSFFIFDSSHKYFAGDNAYNAVSGKKYLAAIYNSDKKANDDWAISPELCGEKQTISFYARAFSEEFPENLEVLYSTTDREPASFKSITTIRNILCNSYHWTPYSFTVPEGAKYFALRFISNYTFMLFIDDITYSPANAAKLELLGYNVYRDGTKLTSAPIAEKTFTDEAPVRDAGYVVTALYNTGESKASPRIHPYATGIEEVATEGALKVGTGYIELSCNGTIFDLSGRMIASGEGRHEVAPGIYMVRLSGKACKVIVK